MTDAQPVYRKVYAPPAYTIDAVDLAFDLQQEHTDGEASVQPIEFALFFQQLDHNHGAAEGERHRQEQGLALAET